MMKTINVIELPQKLMICLRMYQNQGKSGTIRELAELLMPKPAEANTHWHTPNFPNNTMFKNMPKTIEEWLEKISKWKCDICVVVDAKGKRIGLSSQGDKPDIIQKNLEFLVQEDCEIIFCACRSRNPTVKVVEDIAKKSGYTLIMTAPYSVNATLKKVDIKQLQEFLNMQKAKHLADFI